MPNGSSIQLANANFTNGLKASLTCPDRTGLIGEYLLNTNAARALRNIANPSAPAVLTGVGTPVYNAGSLLLSGSASYGNGISGIDTGLLFPNDMTLIAVRKALTVGSMAGGLVPWFGGNNPVYTGFMDYDNWDFYNNISGVPPSAPKIVAPADTAFHFVAGSGANAGVGNMYVATGGVMSTSAGTLAGAAKVTSANTIKLCPASNYQMELCYAAVYNRVLTPVQIAAAYASLVSYFASIGVVIS